MGGGERRTVCGGSSDVRAGAVGRVVVRGIRDVGSTRGTVHDHPAGTGVGGDGHLLASGRFVLRRYLGGHFCLLPRGCTADVSADAALACCGAGLFGASRRLRIRNGHRSDCALLGGRPHDVGHRLHRSARGMGAHDHSLCAGTLPRREHRSHVERLRLERRQRVTASAPAPAVVLRSLWLAPPRGGIVEGHCGGLGRAANGHTCTQRRTGPRLRSIAAGRRLREAAVLPP
mmetsp:Transcript_96994/g.235779  ORF Transcript_96994/g.235779 Transcript_96994/m.235779 type:complete len:231 (-) Transcript_96994:406-1098(-)